MRVTSFKSSFAVCLVLLRVAGGSASTGNAVHLSLPAENTDDVLQAVAVAGVPGSRADASFMTEQEYAEATRRMLDAEAVAIKRIVRKALPA